MLINVATAALLMSVTTVIHACAMMLLLQEVKQHGIGLRAWLRRTRVCWIVSIIITMFVAAVLEALVWAVAYLALGAIKGLEQAIYFSMVTFTTLGYGEIVLDERWRLLASFEAANGIILFGWSTAVVMAAVHRAYFEDGSERLQTQKR